MTTHVPDRPGPPRGGETQLLDEEAISRCLARMAHEIIERNAADADRVAGQAPGLRNIALVGVLTRGVPLASRIRRLVEERSDVTLGVGALDITFYRDDVHVRDGGRAPGRQPIVRATNIPFAIEGMTVVLV